MNNDITEIIEQLERKLLQPGTRQSKAELNILLADDFKEIASDGKEYNKQAIIEELLEEVSQSIEFELYDFGITQIDEELVLATYKINKREQGQKMKQSARSSLWREDEGQWKMVFHQGTLIE